VSDLRTSYLGLPLRTPIVASSSPLTGRLDSLVALESAGVGAVVLPSLFEEQLTHDAFAMHDLLETSAGIHPEAPGGYLPELDDYNTGPTHYLRHIEAAKKRLSIPVIASLNGVTPGGWTHYARLMQDAGADAIELNLYLVAANRETPGRQIEAEAIAVVQGVCAEVAIPVAVKVGPYYSAFAHFAAQVEVAGASGLVLFNRFYQPDIDLETLDVTPHLVLSTSTELRLPLTWIAILHGRVGMSLAATTGVHTWRDVAKVLLAGADVAMMASALLADGPDVVTTVLEGLQSWLDDRAYTSVEQLKGSVGQSSVSDPAAFERANYMGTLTRYANAFR
jgi:dihydroorotate dehydrogenase (fumarate)